MKIEVLGTGCSSCQTLEARVEQAIADTGSDATVEKVEDMKDIMSYGVMSTPALVVNGEVVSAGKTPSVKELRSIVAPE